MRDEAAVRAMDGNEPDEGPEKSLELLRLLEQIRRILEDAENLSRTLDEALSRLSGDRPGTSGDSE